MDEASGSNTANFSMSEISAQRVIMEKHSAASVTNIQTAADVREAIRRKELQEARKQRLELVEQDRKSSQEKFEEIMTGLLEAKEKGIPQELQETLHAQQQLCSLVLKDKDKVIHDLQQELKTLDDFYVKDLRRQAEELNLMMERMEEQITTLSIAYREEMTELEKYCLQESEVLVTKDVADWEQHMKKLWDRQLESLEQRKEKVIKYEAEIHTLMLEIINKQSIIKTEQDANFQNFERDNEKKHANTMIMRLKQIKEKRVAEEYKINLTQMYKRINGLQLELKSLVTREYSQSKYLKETRHQMTKEYNRILQQHERVHKKIVHFEVADVKQFEEMWRTLEGDVKRLVERALAIDAEICERYLGLAWERPAMPVREASQPVLPEEQVGTDPAARATERTKGTSDRLRFTARSQILHKEEMDEETLNKVIELLCNETDLIEDNIKMLLAPLEEEEQNAMQLGSLLYTLGLADEDLPKLAHFLLRYRREQSEESGSADQYQNMSARMAYLMSSSKAAASSIHPDQVLAALQSFLTETRRSRKSSGDSQSSVLKTKHRDISADKAYWESLGNIIPEDRIRLWEEAEMALEQHLVVLKEITELDRENQSLMQENTELRILLQQSLES